MKNRLWLFAFFLITACGNRGGKAPAGEGKGSDVEALQPYFAKATLPYVLADSGLRSKALPGRIPSSLLQPFITDSVLHMPFAKGDKTFFTPLAFIQQKEKETYFIIKAENTAPSTYILVYDKAGKYVTAAPFLVPDADRATTQTTVLDKSFTVSKNTTKRSADDAIAEGKEVIAYDDGQRRFNLIMTDVLNESKDVQNPIDTFPRKNKWAGDWWMNKQNLIAIRDGRDAAHLLVYVRTASESDCDGELKGEFIITNATMATYRQGGDPCVLALLFNGNQLSLSEVSGCGNHRGIDCAFSGQFTRKKEAVKKPAPLKKSKH